MTVGDGSGHNVSFQCHASMVNTEEDTWITLALALLALPLCAFFFRDTWKRWLATHRRTSGHSTVPSTATTTSTSHQGSHRSSTSGSTVEMQGSKPTSAPEKLTHPTADHHARHSATAAMQYWAKKMFRPSGLNQLLGNLLLSSWTILAFDQLFHALFIVSVTFVCPAYNCRNYRSFTSPGCSAGLFEGIQLIIQPFGSCFFIVATLNRFVNVYSQLSRRRFIALRVGTTIVVLVCTAMSIVTALAYSVMSATSSTPEQATQAHELLLLGDFITYSTIGIVSILALIMGLQYVIKNRKAVRSMRPPGSSSSQPNKVSVHAPMVVASAMAAAGTSKPAPQGSSSSPQNAQRLGSIRQMWERVWSNEKRKPVTTVVCIFINMVIIVMFLAEHPFTKQKQPSEASSSAAKSSALLDSAFMSLSHKLFCAMVTIAIHQMTTLVLSKT